MVRATQILLVVLLLAAASVVGAQTPATPCATIDGPSEVDPGAPVVLKAKITGTIETTNPEFKWSVSAGTIMSGQATEEIMVDTTGLAGVEIVATLELSGCKGSVSRTTRVKPPPIMCGISFDGYGDIKFEDEKARLDNFAIQLSNEPQASGAILMAAGQVTFKNEAAERLARAKSYLVNVRKIDPNRIVTFDCGFTLDLNIILSITPAGMAHRSCDSFIAIPVFDVKFTKPRPKSSKRKR